jgi:pimeloyl-ACP methyl ester carboxylesterase
MASLEPRTAMTSQRDSDRSAGGRYAAVNGLNLYYEIHGEGRPLVLLHGAMGTIESCFAQLLPVLAARHQVIAAELQGHGRTADIDRRLSFAQMADDIVALLRSLQIAVADIVGYSIGGAVGIALAMQYPEMVGRLVYAGGTSYRRDGLHPEMLGDMGDAAAALEGSVWHQAYLRVAPEPAAWPRLVDKVMELDRFEGWSAAEIEAVKTPTLLIIGDSDIVRPEHTVEMFRLLGGGVVGDIVGLPAARLAVLPGTSHVGLLERVEWLGSMIDDFLDPQERSDNTALGA